MRYRKIGNTEINASVVGFGGWAIGGWMWAALKKRCRGCDKSRLRRRCEPIDTALFMGLAAQEIIGK